MPRGVRLSAQGRARLAHLSDIRDVASPSQATQCGRELAGEVWLAADLLAARPWLPADTPPGEILNAVLHSEWRGLLALLGEYGPWVYAATVRDLQELARTYGALVTAAAQASEIAVYDAASRRGRLSLLARLETTDYRQPGAGGADLAALEHGFWQLAQAQAARQRIRQ